LLLLLLPAAGLRVLEPQQWEVSRLQRCYRCRLTRSFFSSSVLHRRLLPSALCLQCFLAAASAVLLLLLLLLLPHVL